MRHAIAIDLGGSHASIGVIRENVLLTARDISVEAMDGLQPLLPRLRACVDSLLCEQGLTSADCIGTVLSLPSLVDFRSMRIASVNNKYPDATTVDLQEWSREAFGLPLVLENDARAALLGEVTAGAAQGLRDVVMLTLGTGVGCAVLVDGIPFRTMQPQGGNLGGHIPVRLDGRQCVCGASGCLESEASGWALPLVAKEMPGFSRSALAHEPGLDFATLFAWSDAGDIVASELVRHCIRAWSVGTVGLIHAYGPQQVVFGGGVLARANDVLPAIRSYVQTHAWTPAGPVEIVAAQLGNRAPLYAAIALIEEAERMRER
ncbi:ROK family protein [Silvibacterium dinghuense]|uniref:ROK family protein n=1 Tax=Silvibacterium dinghuense TaxID=1560006 RepID=A0A4Q1SCU5_9BACT|nr:ROK family protein [Silvibacterium dinghuense]RXS94887.1 ROK family protein [Silvibacterium dinghuense]GGH08735.1 glucokinase [Silvibacterium dinghuense]